MSRALPVHANLEHLRKQAKDLLRELQWQRTNAQLADAQHAVAREYGFASWPKLKAHMEEIPVTEHPFAGTWTANVAKSQRHPLNPFQRATLQIVVAGATVTITDVVVSDSGREERSTNTIQADGKERPWGSGGHVAVAQWVDPHVLETLDKKEDQVEGRGTYEVSSDGKTLTVTSGEHVIVFDRVVH